MLHADKIEKFMLAPKPDWCRPHDVAVMIYLMTVADAEGKCAVSQPSIAHSIGSGGVNLSGIRNSIDRLRVNQWVWRDKQPATHASLYTIMFKNLPGKEADVGQAS